MVQSSSLCRDKILNDMVSIIPKTDILLRDDTPHEIMQTVGTQVPARKNTHIYMLRLQ